jgi:hypothetical protein
LQTVSSFINIPCAFVYCFVLAQKFWEILKYLIQKK